MFVTSLLVLESLARKAKQMTCHLGSLVPLALAPDEPSFIPAGNGTVFNVSELASPDSLFDNEVSMNIDRVPAECISRDDPYFIENNKIEFEKMVDQFGFEDVGCNEPFPIQATGNSVYN